MKIVAKVLRISTLGVIATALGACATSFTGSAHVEDGRLRLAATPLCATGAKS